MFEEKRYSVAGYSWDTGADDKGDHNTIESAIKECRALLRDGWDAAFIYDRKTRSCRHAFNGDPLSVFNERVDCSETIYHEIPTQSRRGHRFQLSFRILKTEQEAAAFCAAENARATPYQRKKYPAHYTFTTWKDGSSGFVCWYHY